LPRWRLSGATLIPAVRLGVIAIGSFFANIRFQVQHRCFAGFETRLRLLYAGTNRIADPDFFLIAIARSKADELEQIFPEWLVLGLARSAPPFPITRPTSLLCSAL